MNKEPEKNNSNNNGSKGIEKCFHQVFRSQFNSYIGNGGNCGACTTDEHNKECENYHPIRIWKYEVEDAEKP